MGKGAGCVKILIISPSNVGIEQRTMRPADTGSDVRSNLLAWIAQDQVEGRVDKEKVRVTSSKVLPMGNVRKGDRCAVNVGIELKAYHSTERGRKEPDLEPGTESFLNQAGNSCFLVENIHIAGPRAQCIRAQFHIAEFARYNHIS